jgi:uncharacterized membrane protein (DUF4010 family)
MEGAALTSSYRLLGEALALGALIGLERESSARAEARGPGTAGVRTFALIALVGALTTAPDTGLPALAPVIGLAAVALLVGASYVVSGLATKDYGLTTEIAALLTYVSAAVIGAGREALGAAVAVATFIVLAARLPARKVAQETSAEDLRATGKFALITVVVLPLLPDRAFGPGGLVNPHEVWLMVCLIAGVSFVGYVAMKLVGPGRGLALTGLLGGLVSSTAVTLGMSRRSKTAQHAGGAFALAILLACTMMFARVLVEAAVVHAPLAAALAWPMGAMTAAALVGCGLAWRGRRAGDVEHLALQNPFELSSAVRFGLLYLGIKVIAELAQTRLGSVGLYLSAAVAGLTDVDAITLSSANLVRDGSVDLRTAAVAVTIAAATNTTVKAGLAIALAARATGLRVALSLGPALAMGLLVAIIRLL